MHSLQYYKLLYWGLEMGRRGGILDPICDIYMFWGFHRLAEGFNECTYPPEKKKLRACRRDLKG